MSNYCTCHIDKDNCFWCDYQTVKRSLEIHKKINKRYREAFEKAKREASEYGAMTLDEDIPDDKDEAYRLGAEDMLEDFTDFYNRKLEGDKNE